ncbi:macrophage mannose receptor 1-like [Crotalus adamanteus]|uniref:Macrophage mannose receptor 1-like n=1 Tax=Crotalus adamanteus TaxID=8729 RepID=A0AAW1BKR0_CROAD
MIRHATSAPFHPSTNGMAERMVRITKDALKKITYGDWHHRLADFLLSYRTTLSTSTGRSPAELRWGRKLTTKLDRLHLDRLSSSYTRPRAPRQLLVGAPIWTRNYGPGHSWVPASISRVTGLLSYECPWTTVVSCVDTSTNFALDGTFPLRLLGLFQGGRGTPLGKGKGMDCCPLSMRKPQTAHLKILRVLQTGIQGAQLDTRHQRLLQPGSHPGGIITTHPHHTVLQSGRIPGSIPINHFPQESWHTLLLVGPTLPLSLEGGKHTGRWSRNQIPTTNLSLHSGDN